MLLESLRYPVFSVYKHLNERKATRIKKRNYFVDFKVCSCYVFDRTYLYFTILFFRFVHIFIYLSFIVFNFCSDMLLFKFIQCVNILYIRLH